MSLSIRTIASKKSLNQVLQSKNSLAQFTQPVYYNGNLSIHSDLWVGGNQQLNGNLNIGGTLTVGNLNVVYDERVGRNQTVLGNVNCNGTVVAKSFAPGQVINIVMAGAGDSGFSSVVTQISNGTLFNYSYKPLFSTSYLIVEYYSIFMVEGDSNDTNETCTVTLNVNSQIIGQTQETFLAGTGTNGSGVIRGSVALPITGRFTNTDTTVKTISLNINCADVVDVNYDVSTWLKITEIGR